MYVYVCVWGGRDDLNGRHYILTNIQGVWCFLKKKMRQKDSGNKHSLLAKRRLKIKRVFSAGYLPRGKICF